MPPERRVEQTVNTFAQKTLHVLTKAKPGLPPETESILEDLKKVESKIEKGEKNHLSGNEYVELIEIALKKLSPQSLEDYKKHGVKFISMEGNLTYTPIDKTTEGQWVVKFPTEYKKPTRLVLRAIEVLLQIEHAQDRVVPSPERRAEIAARVFEVNGNLGKEYGWNITGYELAERYHDHYYDGIHKALEQSLINNNTPANKLREIGHSYAHSKLVESVTPQSGKPQVFPSFGPAAYFEERLQAIKDGQRPVKVGTDEFQALVMRLEVRKRQGKDSTLTVNIMPNEDIWVQPYFITGDVKSQHTVNASGNPCIFAGEGVINGKKLISIKDQSGHFRTVDEEDPLRILNVAVKVFEAKGFDISEVKIERAPLDGARNLEYSLSETVTPHKDKSSAASDTPT